MSSIDDKAVDKCLNCETLLLISGFPVRAEKSKHANVDFQRMSEPIQSYTIYVTRYQI